MNHDLISPNNHMVFSSAPPGAPVARMYGGDFCAPLHRGYEWWMVNDNPSMNPDSYILPPGIVFALKHNKNQGNQKNIALFGRDPITGPDKFSRFKESLEVIRELEVRVRSTYCTKICQECRPDPKSPHYAKEEK